MQWGCGWGDGTGFGREDGGCNWYYFEGYGHGDGEIYGNGCGNSLIDIIDDHGNWYEDGNGGGAGNGGLNDDRSPNITTFLFDWYENFNIRSVERK